MGEAIITARGGSGGGGYGGGGAILRVITQNGATLTCTCGSQTQTKTSYGTIDFSVGYGTWTVSSTYNGITKSDIIIVDTIKIYIIDLRGKTYGIQIDMNISDPTAAVSYIDDAIGMTPLKCNHPDENCSYGSWQSIINDLCKPCLYKDGSRVAYLNPNDYTKKIDGTSADITTGSSGDVMVEFAKRWYKFSSPNATTLKFEVCEYDRSADGFVTTAFLSEDGDATMRDFFYYGAYNGWVDISSKLHSISDKIPTTDISYDDSIIKAANNHVSCTIETLFKRTYILGLLMLVTKSRNMDDKIGAGVTSASAAINTGNMNDKGLFSGKNDRTIGVKCFGIEHMWGNLDNWMAGIVITDEYGRQGVKSCAPYSPEGINYINVATGIYSNGGCPTRYAPFANGAIILPTVVQGNQTIGWKCSVVFSCTPSHVAIVGGYWLSSTDGSPFRLVVNLYPSNSYTTRGSRLVAS